MVALQIEAVDVMAKSKSKTTDRDLGFRKFAAAQRANKGKRFVDVGYFVEAIAEYAAANEFGTATIPSRPFMRQTFDKNRDKYLRLMQAATVRINAGTKPVDALMPIANEVRNDYILAIQSGAFKANAESTVDKKGYNAPLVETGQMQRAITTRAGEAP